MKHSSEYSNRNEELISFVLLVLTVYSYLLNSTLYLYGTKKDFLSESKKKPLNSFGVAIQNTLRIRS